MRRAPLTIAIALAAAAAPSAAAAAPAAVPSASVRVVDCSYERHEAAFHARMRIVEGATQMAMRFTLLEDTGAPRPEAISPGILRRWHRSKPGVKRFGYRQGFRNLPENATHRVRVDYRWYSSSGEELARTKRRSAPCRQFKVLPNLTIRLLGITTTASPGVLRYRAAVTNTGKGPATAVPVRLTVDGDVVDTVTLPALAPGQEAPVTIRGPECRRLAKLEVDPQQGITESSDEDNVFEHACATFTNTR
jgi:CARDB